MAMTATGLGGKERFGVLLTGGSSAPHDTPMLERPDWLVAPTLGAIIPGWLLIIPRQPVLNFREWLRAGGEHPESIMRDVREHLGLAAEEVIWFEHGPSHSGTAVGCGVDHAHIHMLVRPSFEFSAFVARARSLTDLEWRVTDPARGYAQLGEGQSYCIAGCGEDVILACDVERAGSQFFRRVVASLTGASAEWDYRRHPHFENIRTTIEVFRALEGAARRDATGCHGD